MEERLSLLKSTFGEIVDIKESNLNILMHLESRIKKIKNIYNEFISTNRDNLFVFTLDSFRFQSKFIDIEFEDMTRMLLSITNRMYCDYYKLFRIIVKYVEEDIQDKKILEIIKVNDNFPLYKDLEPFKQYDFKYIQGLHEIILVILNYIHTYITNKEHDLKLYQSKNKIGLNIDSFVSTFSFNNIVMNQRAMLFITYIEFFHKMHTKYLKRFTTKINLMLSQINNEIKLDSSVESKSTKQETIYDLKQQNLDKDLLRELRVSISDDASVISSNLSKTLSYRKKSVSDAESNDFSILNNEFQDNIHPSINMNEQVSEITDDVSNKETSPFSNEKTCMDNTFTPMNMISNENIYTPTNTPLDFYSENIIEQPIPNESFIETYFNSPFENIIEIEEKHEITDTNDTIENNDYNEMETSNNASKINNEKNENIII